MSNETDDDHELFDESEFAAVIEVRRANGSVSMGLDAEAAQSLAQFMDPDNPIDADGGARFEEVRSELGKALLRAARRDAGGDPRDV